MKVVTARHRTKSELAEEALRDAILRGDIGPGARITVPQLSELLGMSSTPIREAIRVLEADGLVVSEAHRGVWVTELTVAQAEELALLRAPIEGLATRLAVPNLGSRDIAVLAAIQEEMAGAVARSDEEGVTRFNMEWHRHIYAASQTEFVFRHAMRLWIPYPWPYIWSGQRQEASLRQHAEIMTAIRAGDAERAGELMHDHILYQCQSVVDEFRSRESQGSPDGPHGPGSQEG